MGSKMTMPPQTASSYSQKSRFPNYSQNRDRTSKTRVSRWDIAKTDPIIKQTSTPIATKQTVTVEESSSTMSTSEDMTSCKMLIPKRLYLSNDHLKPKTAIIQKEKSAPTSSKNKMKKTKKNSKRSKKE